VILGASAAGAADGKDSVEKKRPKPKLGRGSSYFLAMAWLVTVILLVALAPDGGSGGSDSVPLWGVLVMIFFFGLWIATVIGFFARLTWAAWTSWLAVAGGLVIGGYGGIGDPQPYRTIEWAVFVVLAVVTASALQDHREEPKLVARRSVEEGLVNRDRGTDEDDKADRGTDRSPIRPQSHVGPVQPQPGP
jgi:hypothetical protein